MVAGLRSASESLPQMRLVDDPYTDVFEMDALSRGTIKNTAVAPDTPTLVPSTVKGQESPRNATHWWLVKLRQQSKLGFKQHKTLE